MVLTDDKETGSKRYMVLEKDVTKIPWTTRKNKLRSPQRSPMLKL